MLLQMHIPATEHNPLGLQHHMTPGILCLAQSKNSFVTQVTPSICADVIGFGVTQSMLLCPVKWAQPCMLLLCENHTPQGCACSSRPQHTGGALVGAAQLLEPIGSHPGQQEATAATTTNRRPGAAALTAHRHMCLSGRQAGLGPRQAGQRRYQQRAPGCWQRRQHSCKVCQQLDPPWPPVQACSQVGRLLASSTGAVPQCTVPAHTRCDPRQTVIAKATTQPCSTPAARRKAQQMHTNLAWHSACVPMQTGSRNSSGAFCIRKVLPI